MRLLDLLRELRTFFQPYRPVVHDVSPGGERFTRDLSKEVKK